MKLQKNVFVAIGCCTIVLCALYKITKEITNTVIVLNNHKMDKYIPMKGPAGDRGESAYEIAVRHGFSGTEEEWLNSLKCEGHKN